MPRMFGSMRYHAVKQDIAQAQTNRGFRLLPAFAEGILLSYLRLFSQAGCILVASMHQPPQPFEYSESIS